MQKFREKNSFFFLQESSIETFFSVNIFLQTKHHLTVERGFQQKFLIFFIVDCNTIYLKF